MSSRDPAEDIDLLRICQAVRNRIHNHFHEEVGAEVLEVIDVRLDHDAIRSVDLLRAAFVECQLDIGLAKLNLLPATGCRGVKEPRVKFRSKLTVLCCKLDLVDQLLRRRAEIGAARVRSEAAQARRRYDQDLD